MVDLNTSSLKRLSWVQNHWQLDENEDKIYTAKERNEILEKAVDVYLIWHGKKIAEPLKKVSCMECDNENIQ